MTDSEQYGSRDKSERPGGDRRRGSGGSGGWNNRGGRSWQDRGDSRDRRDDRRDDRRGGGRSDRAEGARGRDRRDDRGWDNKGGDDRREPRRWDDRPRNDRSDGRSGDRKGPSRQFGRFTDRKDDHRSERRSGDWERQRKTGDRSRTWDDRGGSRDRREDRRDNRGADRRTDRGGRPDGRKDFRRDDRSGGRRDDRKRDDRRRDSLGRDDRRRDADREERMTRRDLNDLDKPRFIAPDIDEDVTGREIDKPTRRQLEALEPRNAERVAQHLVMAARYLEVDPEFALEHANAAVRKAGRIAAVREATGVAAYAAEDYALALKELRTHRRISGSEEHLPLMVDCQRALGKVDKALEEAQSSAVEKLDATGKVELAMVVSGIHADAGDSQAALEALQIPQLDKNRGFSYSPRLFRAYAEALRGVGRDKESLSWERQAIVAEAALGLGQFSEPEIVDLGDDIDLDAARETVRDAGERHSENAASSADSSETPESAETTETSDAHDAGVTESADDLEKAPGTGDDSENHDR
ncbi:MULTISPECIES: tetratricopeptide repeat protein [unclassified Candidatus Sulfotelmatobacter]|uniref:tetratricopeptide repeat protein n=1 Tax=unclassified Candidatus Sulfotelmatobacter TaxID=2635724 RepID=UPI001CC2661B|nr:MULTISPECIES: hypothetical protein [unclassified Candidatus Sulfotelmatobacter]